MGDESFSLVLLRLSEPTPHARHSLWLFLPKYSRRGKRLSSCQQQAALLPEGKAQGQKYEPCSVCSVDQRFAGC